MALKEILKKQEEEFDEKYLPKDNGDGTYSTNKYVFPSGSFAKDVKSFIQSYNHKIIKAVTEEERERVAKELFDEGILSIEDFDKLIS